MISLSPSPPSPPSLSQIHDEVADNCGRIHPGDKILAINGEDISLAGQDFVSSLLQVN